MGGNDREVEDKVGLDRNGIAENQWTVLQLRDRFADHR